MPTTFSSSSPLDFYFAYLERVCPTIVYQEFEYAVSKSVADARWDRPESALELNNFATIALIEAENAEDDSERQLLLDLAIEALTTGFERDGHPLCAVHLALVFYLTGDRRIAEEIAYNTLEETFQSAYYPSAETSEPIGLVYLPPLFDRTASEATIGELFRCDTAHQQALIFLAKAHVFTQPLVCSASGLRWLELSASLLPDTPHTNLMLGLSHLYRDRAEGLLYLHRAQQADPAAPSILQALSLAYHDRDQLKNAELWKTVACACQFPELETPSEWRWTEVDVHSPRTYVAYDGCTLAIEASPTSLATSTLLAQGDWPEREMEFWRVWLKPDAVAIDIGADIGSYTFSAAQRVGPGGRVVAIESQPKSLACLQETKAIGGFDCVAIYPAIACDRVESVDWPQTPAATGHGDREKPISGKPISGKPISGRPISGKPISGNLMTAPPPVRRAVSGEDERIERLTLDILVFRENLTCVDFLRVSRENCTLELLAGSSQMISRFQPTILFATPPDDVEAVLAFGNTLRAIGYKLFRYKPYVKQLLPIDTTADLISNLDEGSNAIAIHPGQYETVISLGYSDASLADEAALAELLLVADPDAS